MAWQAGLYETVASGFIAALICLSVLALLLQFPEGYRQLRPAVAVLYIPYAM